MKKSSMFKTIACLVLMVFIVTAAFAQEKTVNKKKLYKEITGKYELDTGDQIMVVVFWVEDGKLFGAPEGEEPGKLVPIEGKELEFEVETPDGQYFDIKFVRDDKDKIIKFILGMGEMEFEAPRIKEDKKEKKK